MAGKRKITQAKPMFGNSRSFSMRHERRAFNPNYQNKSIYVESLDRFVRVRVTVGELRTIDKIGLSEFMDRQGRSLKELL